MIPIIDGLPLVITFRDFGLYVEYGLFLKTFNFGPITMALTQRIKEEVS